VLALPALALVSPTPAADLPLLDQQTIRSPWAAACNGQPDAAALPVDPRTLVKPGINTNNAAAVQFNAWYVDLHNPPYPFLAKLPARVKTCGEFRASVARGQANIRGKQYFQPFSTALGYYSLYLTWGYVLRPSDFDDQVIKRYGATKAPWRNPYPLPGEDPNLTNGGSGQLPVGYMQERNASGRYTGMIGSTCSACHDSRLGTESESTFMHGRSNDANDAGLTQSDIFRANVITLPLELAPLPWSVGRGTTDAIGILDALPAIWDMDSLVLAPSLLEWFPSHAAGMSKAPNWWHRAWKTRQFWDGALTSDNVRSEMAFGVANLTRSAADRRALAPEFEDNNNFFLSLSPPKYSGAINTTLAEQGAVIFHTRDLWASGANATIPKQPGNGSCASCHGVYSPRYAADTTYLPDPRLKGVAGVITPTATIGTDPQRVGLMADERKRRAWNSSWWGYNELSKDWYAYYDDLITSEARRIPRAGYDNGGAVYSPVGPNEWIQPFGYVAPPLYGTWGGAPYLHNGSVPDIWSILKPADRPRIWKRNYTAAGIFGKNQGYDASYSSYDFSKLGWKYTAVACSDNALTNPFLPCSPGMATADILFGSIANVVASQNSLAYQSPPPVTDKQIKSRMIFNTYLYGQSNAGHEFTQSLTDSERWALLEYLKTL
jgi:mono/diheme cytochrome c family protein